MSRLSFRCLLLVLLPGCVTTPPPQSRQSPGIESRDTSKPFRAIAIQINRVDWIDRYEKSIDEIAALGADAVLLNFAFRQENGSSIGLFLDVRMTPTTDQLGRLIDHAKRKKLRVILHPIVLLNSPAGNEWRGTIQPNDWGTWFEAYRDVILLFAVCAEQHKADVLVIGSELVSTERMVNNWTNVIAAIRGVYHGALTYSANWDHYDNVPFWDKLDLIGMNSYWRMGDDANVTPQQLDLRWEKIQGELLPFIRKTQKPLIFLEIGYFSLDNAAFEPWDYTQEQQAVNVDLQARLYEAFLRNWCGKPELGGFAIWQWETGDAPAEVRGYSPRNKPAEKVLRNWLARPGWTVNGTTMTASGPKQ